MQNAHSFLARLTKRLTPREKGSRTLFSMMSTTYAYNSGLVRLQHNGGVALGDGPLISSIGIFWGKGGGSGGGHNAGFVFRRSPTHTELISVCLSGSCLSDLYCCRWLIFFIVICAALLILFICIYYEIIILFMCLFCLSLLVLLDIYICCCIVQQCFFNNGFVLNIYLIRLFVPSNICLLLFFLSHFSNGYPLFCSCTYSTTVVMLSVKNKINTKWRLLSQKQVAFQLNGNTCF